jgi:hypothetical protein
MTTIQIKYLISMIENLTTADFNILIEDKIFKNQFNIATKLKNPDLRSISKRLADYVNQNLI